MNENRFMDINQFDDKVNISITLFDFSAEWCSPCKAQAKIIENLISIYKNRVSIIEINVDEYRELAQEHMIQSIPTLLIFKNGKEIKRFVGLQTENTIVKSLDQVLSDQIRLLKKRVV